MLARRLSRLLRRHAGIEDPEAALKILAAAATTPDLPETAAKLLASFPALLGDLDAVMNEGEEHLKMAMRNLALSSTELTTSNLELETLNITNRAMLESLGQGLLVFNREGICASGYSHACLHLFGGEPSGRHISDVLGLSGGAREDFPPLIGLMFEPKGSACSFEDLAALAPPMYAHPEGLQVALSYKSMQDARGDVMGILLVATDITQKAKAREELKKKEEQVLRTLRIAGNRYGFVHCLRGLETVFAAGAEKRPPADLRRDLHTLKSMAGFFYLKETAELIHDLEGRLVVLPAEGWEAAFMRLRDAFSGRFNAGIDRARWLGREIWGAGFESSDDVLGIASADLLRFAEDLRRMQEAGATPEETGKAFFERLASSPLGELLAFFETQLSYFAEISGRRVRVLYDTGDDVRLFPDFYRGFFDSLTHVARNIVDHAAEHPSEREAQGKPPELQVHLKTTWLDSAKTRFELVIADDGRGISAGKIAEKLACQGHTTGPGADVLQHIFDDGFSTRDSVDQQAGRGIGMNVLKTEVLRLGGALRVDSKEGAGMALTITLPVLWQSPEKHPDKHPGGRSTAA